MMDQVRGRALLRREEGQGSDAVSHLRPNHCHPHITAVVDIYAHVISATVPRCALFHWFTLLPCECIGKILYFFSDLCSISSTFIRF